MKTSKRAVFDASRVSMETRRRNPHIFGPASAAPVVEAPRRAGKRRKEMNQTEAEFSRILQARMDRGEIISFDYEGLTLRWPDGMRYTPDFVVVENFIKQDEEFQSPLIELHLIEVKGAHQWQKDIVKFRAARANWPLFRFEYWQKLDGQWQQIR